MWACAQTKNGRLKRPDCARAAAARCCPRCVASRHPCPPPLCPPLPAARRIFARSSWSTPSPDSLARRTTALHIAYCTWRGCASSPRHVQRALPRVRACLVVCVKTRKNSPATEPVPVPCRLPRFSAFSTAHCLRAAGARRGIFRRVRIHWEGSMREGHMLRRRAVSMPIDRPTCARDT